MKISGNYYKNTLHGKKSEPFELELATNEQELGVLRELATPILREKDSEFRGIRELQINTGTTVFNFTKKVNPNTISNINSNGYEDKTDDFTMTSPDIAELEMNSNIIITPKTELKQKTTSPDEVDAKMLGMELDIRQKAKALKIKYWHLKGIDTLIKEIENANK